MGTAAGWVYLAGQLGHLSGQSDVWAVEQRASAAGLLAGFVTVADLIEAKKNYTKESGACKNQFFFFAQLHFELCIMTR